METIIFKAHITIVTFFLVFFLFKTILLLAGKKEMLDKIRKYKMVDMILGILILVTGGMLWYYTSAAGHRMWLDVKTVLVLASIGLGIVSMKKENKALAILTCVILIYVYGVAETKSLKFKKDTVENVENTTNDTSVSKEESTETNEKLAEINAIGKTVYEANCNECHGFDGTLGQKGAANLKTTTMFFSKKVALITTGKGLMQGFGDKLSKTEIEAVASYVATLQN